MEKFKHYTRDVLYSLRDRASAQAGMVERDPDPQFQAGVLAAYYEVLSMMRNQLDAFGIEPEEVDWPDDFDLERELIKG